MVDGGVIHYEKAAGLGRKITISLLDILHLTHLSDIQVKIPCRELDLLFELSWEKWVRDTNLDVVSLLIVLVFMGMHGIIKEMIRECKEK